MIESVPHDFLVIKSSSSALFHLLSHGDIAPASCASAIYLGGVAPGKKLRSALKTFGPWARSRCFLKAHSRTCPCQGSMRCIEKQPAPARLKPKKKRNSNRGPASCQYPNYRLAPQHFLYFWPLPHEQGAFGLVFFLPVGLVNAWLGSLRVISSTRFRASVASALPCADASV